MSIDRPDKFEQRHIGPDEQQLASMLRAIGVPSLDALVNAAIPGAIRLKRPLQLPPAEAEHDYLHRLRTVAARNQGFKSFIGMGYHGTITPSVILRNLFENPSWYTPYTPYQAEIAQGRLEALLNFQTMVRDLTAMDIATASLLDEATAAAEAMAVCYSTRGGATKNVFFVSRECHPQTIEVVRTRAHASGITVAVGDHRTYAFGPSVFGALVQYPTSEGAVHDYRELRELTATIEAALVVAA